MREYLNWLENEWPEPILSKSDSFQILLKIQNPDIETGRICKGQGIRMSAVTSGPISEISLEDQSLTSFLGYAPEAKCQTVNYRVALAGREVCFE